MKKKILIISAVTIMCLMFATVAHAASASYLFKGVTSASPAKTNTFTLAKGAVTITGTHSASSNWGPSDLQKFSKSTVKYELYCVTTGKLCGSVEIPICKPTAKNVSFSNIPIGKAPTSGKYYIKVSTTLKPVSVSGSGTANSYNFSV
jgi:hypothetical protein